MNAITQARETTAALRAQLVEQIDLLDRQCQELATQLTECRAERQQLRTVLKSLDSAGTRRRAKPVRERQPTLDADHVLGVVLAMLRPDATMPLEAVQDKLEQEARAANCSCIGLHARLRKALRDDRLVLVESGEGKAVRLRSAGPVPAK